MLRCYINFLINRNFISFSNFDEIFFYIVFKILKSLKMYISIARI